MGSLGALLSTLIATDVGATVSRYKRNGFYWLIAGFLFLNAYVFALVAAGLYLSTIYPPVIASLIVAAAFIVLGLIVLCVLAYIRARDRRIAAERRRQSQLQSGLIAATALSLVRKQPLLAAGVAVAMGAFLGLTSKRKHSDD
ncbi:phage holin family protein [Pararhizobium arenae]|uniref:phage holin family protein n=1 Tax=Pararhizobium arenae TaxID=1856850 RepID=UPI00094B28EA|nr:phage holin family protein [Pararhizobium arenae]